VNGKQDEYRLLCADQTVATKINSVDVIIWGFYRSSGDTNSELMPDVSYSQKSFQSSLNCAGRLIGGDVT
jgi:hypothetical protein